jgi:hypothetical protein
MPNLNLLVIDSVIACVCGVGAGEVVCSDLRQDWLEREIDVEPVLLVLLVPLLLVQTALLTLLPGF